MHNPHGGDPEAVARTLGMKQVLKVCMDFSVNINPMGPPSCIRNVMFRAMDHISQYPPVMAQPAVSALAKAHGVGEDSVIVGNGSTEIIGWIVQALKPARAGWVIPCYTGYAEICAAANIAASSINSADPLNGFPVSLDAVLKTNADMIFLASPNNPTGTTLDPAELLDLAARAPSRWIVLDESFVDFLPDSRSRTLVRNDLPENLVVVKSLTKFFAIPGLRLGMACANPRTIKRIAKLRLPWTVNGLAQAAARVIYNDKAYIKTTGNIVTTLRKAFSRSLSQLPGFTVYPSEANFILVRLPPKWPAPRVQEALLKRGILIRSCQNFPGLDETYCRLAVRPREEIELFMNTIRALVAKGRKRKKVRESLSRASRFS